MLTVSRSVGHVWRRRYTPDGVPAGVSGGVAAVVRDDTGQVMTTVSVPQGAEAVLSLSPQDISGWPYGVYRTEWDIELGTGRRVRETDLWRLAAVSLDDAEISDDDVYSYAPHLADVRDGLTGTVRDGATTTRIPLSFRGDTVGFLVVGAVLEVNGTRRHVSNWSDGVAVLAAPLDAAPAAGTQVFVRRPLRDAIRAGLETVKADMARRGLTDDDLADLAQVRTLVLEAVCAHLSYSRVREPNDIWAWRYAEHNRRYNAGLEALTLRVGGRDIDVSQTRAYR